MLNFSDPRFWMDAVVIGMTVINTIVVWLRRPGVQAQEAVNALSGRLDKELDALRNTTSRIESSLSARLLGVEERMLHMPTDEELATLRGDVQSVAASVEGQRDLLKRVEHQQTLILEQLLARSK